MKKDLIKTKEKIKKNSGAAMLIAVIFFLFISLAIISGLVSSSVREFRNASVNLSSKQSYFLAESGVEDAYYRLKKAKSIDSSELITLNGNTVMTTITSISSTQKLISSLGDVNSYQRKVNLALSAGTGVVFKYGTQAGRGGFIFENGARLLGSLYSNGNIIGAPGAYITGDAYVAGSSGSISNASGNFCIGGIASGSNCSVESGKVPGNAYANSVTKSNVTGTIYCQSGSGNNKSCNTSQANPVEEPLPISEDNITKWKTDATNGGTTDGNVTISSPTTLGPRKIIGNLTIDNTLTIADTIYVTGNIIINKVTGSPTPPSVKLNSSYGITSGIIIADGYINIGNGVVFKDSGTLGSYILLLSNSTCDADTCGVNNAITVSNNSDISIVNAQKGTVYLSNNTTVKEAVGNKIKLQQGVSITYGSGLLKVNFISGLIGSWAVTGWREVL